MLEQIERIENTATFKAFLFRIWFKSFSEYKELFGNDLSKRKEATEWCLETYPNLSY